MERYLPSTLINRVFVLYSVTLLLMVGGGLLLFLKYQFERQVVDTEVESIMLVEVVAQVVQDSVVIGDFDTVQKLLNKAVQGSQFATAQFLSVGAGVVHAENRARNSGQAPAFLQGWVANSLPEVNRAISVGGRDYGVLRLQFDTLNVAAGLWLLSLIAFGTGLISLFGGLVIIRLALARWLGGLAKLSEAVELMGTSLAPAQHLTIADAPAEIQNLVIMVNRTSGLVREREMTRRALQETEERWQLAVRGANDGIWDWNPVDATVQCSDRWKSMLGYGPGEIGENEHEWFSRVHPEDVRDMQAELHRHLRGETEFYKHEYRLRCKDGSYKWILDRGKAMFDGEGRAVRMSGSHGDITERHQAESHLRERTDQLNAIFALSPDGFVSFDRDRRLRSVNPAFLAMTGLEQSELLGRTESEFVTILRGICTPGPWSWEMTPMQAGGTGHSVGDDRDAHMGMVPRRIELAKPCMRVLDVSQRDAQTESVSQILYFSDVTHETEVDRMKSEFLSTAAHELRTPMASVLGYSEVLHAQEFERAEQQDLLEIVLRNARLMAEIINELLDLARIEARRGKDFTLERLAAEALVQEIVDGFKVPMGREQPRLRKMSAAMWLRGDRGKLTQAIGNVLSNAYKYSPNGGPVEIELIDRPASPSSRDDSHRCGIRIKDTGIGMSQEQLSRVCERFYRADTSGKILGTGLGMSIVKEIIELHGGEMEFVSLPGRGSTITLWVPANANLSMSLPQAQEEC